ncbi:MAG: VOC family protein [Crocinitomicaceae bacterium]|nr:VOC family protein [Crocinitomicaceae bacterium]
MNPSFHIAFPIKDIELTKKFYCDVLGCTIGRSASNWIDLNFFGHQITAHVNKEAVCSLPYYRSNVNALPLYHFGAVLQWNDWHRLLYRLMEKKIPFLIGPKTVFEGEVGEQKTFFLEDPNGYAIEFKSFQNEDNLFKST